MTAAQRQTRYANPGTRSSGKTKTVREKAVIDFYEARASTDSGGLLGGVYYDFLHWPYINDDSVYPRETLERMTAGTAANRDSKFLRPENRLANGQRCFAFD